MTERKHMENIAERSILVLMKAVPSMEHLVISDHGEINRNSQDLEWNEADRTALETALRLKDESGARVTVLSMGPEKLRDSFQELIETGIDEAVLIAGRSFAGSDTYATASVLASFVNMRGGFDLILAGRRSLDGETGQVPGELAGLLDIPYVSNAEDVHVKEMTITARRRLEETVEELEVQTPAAVSMIEYSCRLRSPSLAMKRAARERTVLLLSESDIPLSGMRTGRSGSLTEVISSSLCRVGVRNGPKTDNREEGISFILRKMREANR